MTSSSLKTRIASALVIVPVVLLFTGIGGPLFALFTGAVALGLYWEWATLTGHDGFGPRQAIAYAALAVATLGWAIGVHLAAFAISPLTLAITVLAASVLGVALAEMRAGGKTWLAMGLVYAGGALVAIVIIRLDESHGLEAMVWLFALVWGTDTAAYACGRTLGGPKLWPRVSPKKTWSGFIGGITLGALAGVLAMGVMIDGATLGLFVFGLIIAAVSQGGDLLESALKRHFGVKDSSQLIPGHGGIMDRLDGMIAASMVAFAVGLWRGGVDGVAEGMLLW